MFSLCSTSLQGRCELGMVPLVSSWLPPPFDSRVRDAEPEALDIALGRAAGLGSDHGDVASGLARVGEAGFEQRGLRAPPPPFGDGACSGEQGHAIMNRQRSGSNGMAFNFRQEGEVIAARAHHAHDARQQFGNVRVFAPAFGSRARPQFAFFGSHQTHLYGLNRGWGGAFFEGQTEDVGQLDRTVTPFPHQGENPSVRERAHFVEDRSAAFFEECLDAFHIFGKGHFEEAESEGLCTGRIEAVEHCVGSGDLDPTGPAAGEYKSAGFHKAGVCRSFGALQAAGQGEIAVPGHEFESSSEKR